MTPRFIKKQFQFLTTFTSQHILVVFASFWLTVLGVRGGIFWLVDHGIFPWIFIGDYHIHHFVSGFLVIVISAVLITKTSWFRYVPLFLFGCGMGLVVDETIFWLRGDFGYFAYWSIFNLLAVGVGASIIVLWYSHKKKQERDLTLSVIRRVWATSWPLIVMTSIGFILLVEIFSFENTTLWQIKEQIKDHDITRTLLNQR